MKPILYYRQILLLTFISHVNAFAQVNLDDQPWLKYQSQGNKKAYVQQFEKYGMLYKTSVLSKEEFSDVVEELDTLSLNSVKETTSSVAKNRTGARIPSDSKIYSILSNENGDFMKLINELVSSNEGSNSRMVLSDIVPIEMRIYEQRGASMEMHYDDVLFTPEQIEVVFTIENTSDCSTLWEEKDGEKKIMKEVQTEKNSAIILFAGEKLGCRHAVSPLKQGKRVILKFVFVQENAAFLEDADVHVKQFGDGKKNKKKNKKR